MVDVARVGIEVDARQVRAADDALRRMAQGGQVAERAVQGLGSSAARQSAALGNVGSATRQAAVHATAFGRAMSQANAQTQGVVGGLNRAATQAAAAGNQFRGASMHTSNLAAQFNDIGVTLASGQSPFLIALQQGTQVNQVLAQMGANGRGAVSALGTAFASVISPMSLVTIGIIAGGAALAQWGLAAISARNETRSLAELTDALADSVDNYRDATDDLLNTVDEQAEAYGALAVEMREVQKIQAQLAQVAAQEALDKVTQSLNRETGGGFLANPVLQDFLNLVTGKTQVERFFSIPRDETHRVSILVSQFERINKSLRESKGNAEEQNEHARNLLTIATSLAKEYDGINKTEREFLEHLAGAADQSARIVHTMEEMTVQGVKRVETSRSNANWIERTLRLLQTQEAEAATIAEHGANSAEVEEQRAQAARAALQADIERREIADDTADSLRAALEAQIRARVAADERTRFDREVLRIAKEKQAIEERDAQIVAARQHAEESIAQRLRNRIEVARAIVVHGKESVQAKLAEEAVSRRLFELDLERQGITGEMRDNLIAQYEAAAQIESQIVQAQPAFEQTNSTIQGIAQAWGNFVADGFRDFQGFAKSVLDTFKRMLAQMVAQAAQNRIMIQLGMSGAGGAGGGGGGLLGGLFGGGGGGGGGSPLSFLGKLFGGGGDGGGFLGGLFGGGAAAGGIAGGGAAALASGAATSAAFGFGPAAGLGAGGLAAGGGAAATAGGLSLAAVAAPIAAAGLVFLALQKKTQIIDQGLKVAIDGADVLVNRFTDIQESRFFGLSTRERTRSGSARDDVAAAISAQVGAQRQAIERYLAILGHSTDALDDFSTTIRASYLQDGQLAAQALEDVGNEMAHVAATAAGLDISAANAGAELRGLVEEFIAAQREAAMLKGIFNDVNRAILSLGQFRQFLGAGQQDAAVDLARRFGGVDAMQDLARQFFDNFIPEPEQIRLIQSGIASALGGRSRIPESIEAFRALVEAQDLTTEAGRQLYTTLLRVAPQFAVVMEYEQRLAGERREAAERAAAEAAEAEARLAAERERAAEAARLAAEREAERLAAERASFEARAQADVFGLTDSPEQALARSREAALAAGRALGADLTNVIRYYDLLREQAENETAAQLAEQAAQLAEQAAQQAEAERQLLEQRAGALETIRNDDTFFTLEQQFDRARIALRMGFNEIGQQLPETGFEFGQLVETLVATEGAGSDLVAALLELAPAFANAERLERQLADQRNRTVQVQLRNERDAYERTAQLQRDRLAAAQSLIGGILAPFGIPGAAGHTNQFIGDAGLPVVSRIRGIAGGFGARAGRAFRAAGRAGDAFLRQVSDVSAGAVDHSLVSQMRSLITAGATLAQQAIPYTQLATALNVAEHIGGGFNLASLERAANDAARLVNLFGGRFAEVTDNFYGQFYSIDEQREALRDSLDREFGDTFAQLGVSVPRNREQFRDLVAAQDLSTESGRRLYAGLLEISSEFARVTDEAGLLNDQLTGSQALFRTLREETLATTAPRALDEGPAVGVQNDRADDIIRAITTGNINLARLLSDLVRETERDSYEPTTAAVPNA